MFFIRLLLANTWKTQSFILKAKLHLLTKAVLLHLSSFWLLRCGNIAVFRTVLWLAWSPRLGQNTRSWELFSEKKSCSTINFFSSSNMFFIRLFLANIWKIIRGSPCSFKRKGEFISPLSLVWGKSLTFCTCTRSCARANDGKIVRSRDAQCNTKDWITLSAGLMGWLWPVCRLYFTMFRWEYVDTVATF